MKFRFVIMLLLVLVAQSGINAQETKLKRKLNGEIAEYFYVLKEDKQVKHGLYVKYRVNIFDNKSVVEIGNFKQGVKDGDWYFFSKDGYLRHEGKYADGEKSGLWLEYYPPVNMNNNTLQRINSMFDTNEGVKLIEHNIAEIDRSSLSKAAEGEYSKGAKVGEWSYYAPGERLMQKYDHSTDSLTASLLYDDCRAFLGGCARFYSRVNDYEVNMPEKTSKASVKVDTKGAEGIKIELASAEGDDKFAELLLQMVKGMEEDFLSDKESTVHMVFEKNEGGAFHKFNVSLQ